MHEAKLSPELVRDAERATDAALRYWFARGLTDEQIADRTGQDAERIAEARAKLTPQPQDERGP